MPRFLLALTVTLTALTFALALTARAWGETQPPHPALREFLEGCEGKTQPCLFGIASMMYGEAYLEPLDQRLTALGYSLIQEGPGTDDSTKGRLYGSENCGVSVGYTVDLNLVFVIEMHCKGLEVGDVVKLWGPPDLVHSSPPSGFHYSLSFVWVRVESTLNLHSHIQIIIMAPSVIREGFSWAGLLPQWRYCQLEPGACTYGY